MVGVLTGCGAMAMLAMVLSAAVMVMMGYFARYAVFVKTVSETMLVLFMMMTGLLVAMRLEVSFRQSVAMPLTSWVVCLVGMSARSMVKFVLPSSSSYSLASLVLTLLLSMRRV